MYGVTLWEMFTFGQDPWMGLNGSQILQVKKPRFAACDIWKHTVRDIFNFGLCVSICFGFPSINDCVLSVINFINFEILSLQA